MTELKCAGAALYRTELGPAPELRRMIVQCRCGWESETMVNLAAPWRVKIRAAMGLGDQFRKHLDLLVAD